VLPVSAQREALWLEPQARLAHLPGAGAGAEPADQAQEAADTGETTAPDRAGDP
jgi:hypothetical protein